MRSPFWCKARCPLRTFLPSLYPGQSESWPSCLRHDACRFACPQPRRAPRPAPDAPAVTGAGKAQAQVESLTRAPATPPALVFRCRLSLRAAAPDPPSHLRLAAEMHGTPIHGSWLHQVEWWCSVLARRFVPRGACGAGEDLETQLYASLEGSNTHAAHPSRWTYTGPPLGRATPCSQTRRQPWHGLAWLRPRPQRFVRALYPPSTL